MRLIVFVLFALVCAVHVQTKTVSCKDLCESFNRFVGSATDVSSTQCTEDCSSSRIKFLHERVQQQHPQFMTRGSSSITLNITQDSVLTDLIVLSILGRAVTKQPSSNDAIETYVYYKYDENKDRIQPEYKPCNFEKSMYVSLLVVTTGILIVILFFHQETAPEKGKSKAVQPEPQNNAENEAGGQGEAFRFTLSQSSQARYRPLYSQYT